MLGYFLGHRYPAAPSFGLPCPTTIFTLGLLLWKRDKMPAWLFLIPLLWSAIGFSAALVLGMKEDVGAKSVRRSQRKRKKREVEDEDENGIEKEEKSHQHNLGDEDIIGITAWPAIQILAQEAAKFQYVSSDQENSPDLLAQCKRGFFFY